MRNREWLEAWRGSEMPQNWVCCVNQPLGLWEGDGCEGRFSEIFGNTLDRLRLTAFLGPECGMLLKVKQLEVARD